jgi:hypothetical protein
MSTYLKRTTENNRDQITAATHPAPTSGPKDNSGKRREAEDGKWLLDTKEAARSLGLSPHTLSKWRITGRGPPFLLLGRRCLYEPETLRRWSASRSRRSTSDPGAEAA